MASSSSCGEAEHESYSSTTALAPLEIAKLTAFSINSTAARLTHEIQYARLLQV
jgi:hypothetical protein